MQSVKTHLFDKIVLSLMEYVQKYHRNHSDEINYFGEKLWAKFQAKAQKSSKYNKCSTRRFSNLYW